MKKCLSALCCGGLLWLLATPGLAAQEIKLFQAGSYQEIVTHYRGKPFILVLWSLDCPPCYREFAFLAEQRKRQAFNLVLIAIDGADAGNDVAAVLAKYHLQSADAWLFADNAAPALRYEIDPLWYGETPRSYLFTRTQQRQAVSGVLSKAQLRSVQSR